MVHIYKEMMQDEEDYARLCKKYGEAIEYRRYLPEINGDHHNGLRERERLEGLGQSNKQAPDGTIKDRDKRQVLEGSMMATGIAAVFGAVFLFVACIGLLIGLFSEFGAAWGGIANIIWISGFLYLCYRIFLKIMTSMRRLELLEYMIQAERRKLLDEEMAKMKEEQELEALRKKSKLNFCKPRTSKVQGQE